jgi:thiamine biosynthesis lipoprotein
MAKSQEQTKYIGKTPELIPGMKRFTHDAMATIFEIFIVHEDEKYAGQAARAAFAELDRLEMVLSRFEESSEITRINHLPAGQILRLSPDTFECLKISHQMNEQTNKAFDVTIGPLLDCWRNDDGTTRTPTEEELEQAKQHTGMHLLELDESMHAIWLSTSPLLLDLGGIGKGFAVDKMAESLREWSINIALISGGFSSILALDAPEGMKGWPLTMSNPNNHKQILVRPFLHNRALAGSGIKKGAHIIDPRKSQPIEGKLASWSSAKTAAVADALSTAFMIMDLNEIKQYCSFHPDEAAMIIPQQQGDEIQKENILRFGSWEDVELTA